MTRETIPLGFEVGTGASVAIPLRHLAVTGQTQESGKTTTLEALVARAGVRAIAFVTKRGEGSFAEGRRVTPYFRDRADWQFVDALLEAQLHEKNRYLRSWIIKICRTTKTLAEVQAAVKTALITAKGKNEGAYTQLDAYLELIVPEIARAPMVDGITLQPGLNVMDVSAYATPMQMLFIQSALDWVNAHERGVVTIMPEAWEFVPQSKGSPVKASAVGLVRKGAGLGNFIWVDSQDMAAVDNEILRGCAVWLIGVQREANEIDRNLKNIPKSLGRPKADEVATLKRGQFFACFHDRVVRTYVQPAWMGADEARAVARGQAAASTAPARRALPTPPPEPKEDPSMCQEHARLQQEVTTLRSEIGTMHSQLEESKRFGAERRREVEQLRPLGEAVAQVVKGLAMLGVGGRGPGTAVAAMPVDEEAIIQRVLARVPAGGAVIQVTPPAALRAEFQREEVERLLTQTKDLSPLARRVLKLLEALEGARLFQKTIAERLGRATRGGSVVDLGVAVKSLAELGFVDVDPKNGVRASVRQKIAGDLAAYQATETDIEATYQRVLFALATEDAAAA